MYELKPTITKYQQVKQIPMRECLKRNTHTHTIQEIIITCWYLHLLLLIIYNIRFEYYFLLRYNMQSKHGRAATEAVKAKEEEERAAAEAMSQSTRGNHMSLSLYIYMYIYIYIFIYISHNLSLSLSPSLSLYMYMYIYIYREREREIERYIHKGSILNND